MSQAYPYPIALTPVMVLPLQWCSPKALRTIAHSQWSYWGPGMSRYCWSHQILLGTSVIFSVKCPHMRNIVIPRYIWLHPLWGQLSISDNVECWVSGEGLPRAQTHFLCRRSWNWRLWPLSWIFGNHFHRDSAHLPLLCSPGRHSPALLLIHQWEVLLGVLANQTSIISHFIPLCVSKGLGMT